MNDTIADRIDALPLGRAVGRVLLLASNGVAMHEPHRSVVAGAAR